MNTATTLQISSSDSETTELIAEKIGHQLRGGEVIELSSDLGGGKTTFVRGLVRGAGSGDKVASPTFTISKFYKARQFDIHHFDFYRLQDAGIMADEIAEVAGDKHTVTVVEWGDIVQHVLPAGRMTITIVQTPEGTRLLTIKVPANLDYLIKDVRS